MHQRFSRLFVSLVGSASLLGKRMAWRWPWTYPFVRYSIGQLLAELIIQQDCCRCRLKPIQLHYRWSCCWCGWFARRGSPSLRQWWSRTSLFSNCSMSVRHGCLRHWPSACSVFLDRTKMRPRLLGGQNCSLRACGFCHNSYDRRMTCFRMQFGNRWIGSQSNYHLHYHH